MELVQVLTQDVESPGARATLEIMMDESGVPNRNLRWSALDEHAMLVLQAFLAMYMFRPISVFAVSCCIRYNALITRRFGSVDFGGFTPALFWSDGSEEVEMERRRLFGVCTVFSWTQTCKYVDCSMVANNVSVRESRSVKELVPLYFSWLLLAGMRTIAIAYPFWTLRN